MLSGTTAYYTTGNVGIGTASPDAELDVYTGNIGKPAVNFSSSYSGASTSGTLKAYNTNQTTSSGGGVPTGGPAIYAEAYFAGIYAVSTSTAGGAGTGVLGAASGSAGYGVFGTNSSAGYGVYGASVSGTGVYGTISGTTGGAGVWGVGAYATTGVYGTSTSGYGIYGNISGAYTGYPGYFAAGASSGGQVVASNAQIYSKSYSAGASTSLNFNLANAQYGNAAAGAITLSGIQDGGSYSYAATTGVSGTFTFSSNDCGGACSFYYSPGNGNTSVAGTAKVTIYTFMRLGNNVYVAWITGF